MKALNGHTSAETAYLVEDYPYGWRHRCKIRYWLELKPKNGYRFVSQTTNPRVAGEPWNKPKASTYSDFAVMYLDEEKHVQHAGLHFNCDAPDMMAFYNKWFPQLDDAAKGELGMFLRKAMIYNPKSWRKWFMHGPTARIDAMGFPEPTLETLMRVFLCVNKETLSWETIKPFLPGICGAFDKTHFTEKARQGCFYNLTSTAWMKGTGPAGFQQYDINVPQTGGIQRVNWSGKGGLPWIGGRINATINNLGPAIVHSYCIEGDYLGLQVYLLNRPEWHATQNPDRPIAIVFGAEIEAE
jgi:hypothetical protein